MRERVIGVGFGVALLAASLFSGASWADGADNQRPLPAPAGHYAVGRTSFDWTDESRPDSESVNGHREIVVWVWYPASPKPGAEPAEWMPGKWGTLFWSKFLRDFPDAAQKGKVHPINTIRTHSYPDAPVASALKKYPVLLFAPGKGDLPLEYSNLIEDIVSRGYIVAGIVPTHDCGFTVFADGRVVEDPPAALLRPEPGTSPQEFMARVVGEMSRAIRLWSGDLTFALNQLDGLNSNSRSPFRGRLDLRRVGAFGHSQGGASSFQVARDDPRVRAVLDLDGMLSPEVADAGTLTKAVLVLSSDVIPRQVLSANKLQRYAPILQTAKPGYHLRLAGSTHYFSSDLGLMPFLPESARTGAPSPGTAPQGGFRMALVGSTDPERALRVTKAYVQAFFDQSLEGKTSTLLNGPSRDYPEITFESITSPAAR